MAADGGGAALSGAAAVARGLWAKVMEDDVFFMASAVAFSIIVATLPLVLLAVGITGYVLSAQVADPVEGTVGAIAGLFPHGVGEGDVAGIVRGIVEDVVAQRSGFTVLGALLFVWLATRLVGTLRVVLRQVFQVSQDRGVVHGKLFDVLVVVVGALLISLNLGVTVALGAALRRGGEALGMGGGAVGAVEAAAGHLLALASIWALFLMVYRYLPARRIPWRTAMVGATFAAVAHEALKLGFSWYATRVADYSSAWGNLSTVGVLFFWIYYEAVVFILGGEVAHVVAPSAPAGTPTQTNAGAAA